MGIMFGAPTYKFRKWEINFDSIRDYGGLDSFEEWYTSSYLIRQVASKQRYRRNSDFGIKNISILVN
jgi:hypothetical protein